MVTVHAQAVLALVWLLFLQISQRFSSYPIELLQQYPVSTSSGKDEVFSKPVDHESLIIGRECSLEAVESFTYLCSEVGKNA